MTKTITNPKITKKLVKPPSKYDTQTRKFYLSSVGMKTIRNSIEYSNQFSAYKPESK